MHREDGDITESVGCDEAGRMEPFATLPVGAALWPRSYKFTTTLVNASRFPANSRHNSA